MDFNKLIKYWEDGSKLDFLSAKDILEKTERFSHAAFFLHLSVEKILKAKYVKSRNKQAPLSHNLLFIAKEAQITLTPEQEKMLSKVNEFNLESRYPDDIAELQKKMSKSYVLNYFGQVENFLKWISQN
jgi:HEPN domain-containing protein